MLSYTISNRRYTGSKSQLVDWIIELAEKNCTGDSFADIFAGTGIVAEKASEKYSRIIVNDFLPSNQICYQAFYGGGKYNQAKIDKIIMKYNLLNADELSDNYFSISYGGKYFSKKNAKIIGYIRQDIEDRKNITKREKHILTASLVYSTDKIANTVGHYDAYFKDLKNSSEFYMKSIEASEEKTFEIHSIDANKLVKKLCADIVYIDPPYNSRQYSRFYHVLDNLVTWKKPELYGVAMKPEPANISEYSKTGALKAFTDLISDLKCKFIIVSYNNTYNPKSNSSKNKITLEEIESVLTKKGTTKVFNTSHRHFNAGNTKFDDHKEYVFITKVQ